MPDDDARLRAALSDLGEQARAGLRPPGLDGIPGTVRRRRLGAVAGGAAAVLLAAGVFWAVRPGPPSAMPAAPVTCAPAEGRAYLPADATEDQSVRVQVTLAASAEVTAYDFEDREHAWARFQEQYKDAPDLANATRTDTVTENWRFELRCASDFPAVKERLAQMTTHVDRA